ncbi:MAG: type III pantothenate kinase [Tenacibaculum sp.]|nr:type III pantothenate kinase [Tenacibaculum sp.]
MYLIIDVGNTRVKTAVFEEDTIVNVEVFDKSKIITEIENIILKYNIEEAIISSVASLSLKKLKILHELVNLKELTKDLKVPFKNLYKTPNTLGADRVALVTSAVKNFPNKNVLVIDAGTCITFDFKNKKEEYLGGAISLGVNMRYKALHTFTSKLPFLEMEGIENFIGNDTNTSIHSGVINGICKEIDGVIRQYKEKFKDLTVVLTGGDANFLAKQLKNTIFVSPNFILEGLFTILIYNKTDD